MIVIEIIDIPKDIIILVVIIAIILLIPRESVSSVSKNLTGEFLIIANFDNAIYRESINEYTVDFQNEVLVFVHPESLKYKDDPLEVVPIVTFKGESKQMDAIYISQDEIKSGKKDVDLFFNIKKSEPIITNQNEGEEFIIKEKDRLHFHSAQGGDFLVTLVEYDTSFDSSSLKNSLIPKYSCKADFKIECDKDQTQLYLQEEDCINDICSDTKAVCEGSVEITTNKLDCENKKNTATIRVKGGIRAEFKEELLISFWRIDPLQCIKGETDYKSLTALCGNERLSGLYIFHI